MAKPATGLLGLLCWCQTPPAPGMEDAARDLQIVTAANALNLNQMARWVRTKEDHAGKIISLVTEYCLCQRIRPVADPKTPFKSEADYIAALEAHHKVMLSAVKCKQSVDPGNAEALEAAVADMCKMYLPA
ncbi:unnamed protein product [Polarella glacialis]|nr:unnamed protein product [Polarella glacialis]